MNFQKYLTQLDVNKIYVLDYVDCYLNNSLPSLSYSFSADEMKTALALIPEWNFSQELLYKPLRQMLEAAACVNGQRALPRKYPESSIGLIHCARNGCEECQKTLRQNFAVLLALHFDELVVFEQENVALYAMCEKYEEYDGFICPIEIEEDLEEFKRFVS